jgi:hypothetical protein
MQSTSIPGYTYGAAPRSPLTLQELDLLKQAVLFTNEDEEALRLAGQVLADQTDEVLDVWYGFVASHPHLVHYFTGPDRQPIGDYLSAVRRRFGQWILDTCDRPYDQAWLDYQYEIGLRHSVEKKNRTDGVQSVPGISMRYIIAFIYPITATIKPFLAKKGHGADVVDKMHQAWFKSVTIQVALWAQPYVKDGQY